MRRIVRFVQVQAGIAYHPGLAGELSESDPPQDLGGYILKQPSSAPRGMIRFRGFRMVVTSVFGEPEVDRTAHIRQQSYGTHSKMCQLQCVGRLVPLAAPSNRLLNRPLFPSEEKGGAERDAVEQQIVNAITLRPVQSGQSYRITSPSPRGLVRPDLAGALEAVFERFAREHGFTGERPLEIVLTRGYKVNSHGHKEGRAADIASVGGKSLLQWKQAWDQALAVAETLANPGQRTESIAAAQQSNLGYRLYKALQAHGGWRVNPHGWRVYRNVMQLFGPWTATEGPWKAMQVENPAPEERQRLADQRWVFQAHQDHIHVAR